MISCVPGWPRILYVAKDGPEQTVLLSHSPCRLWDYTHVHRAWFMWCCGSNPRLCTYWRSALPMQLQSRKCHVLKIPLIIPPILPHFAQLVPSLHPHPLPMHDPHSQRGKASSRLVALSCSLSVTFGDGEGWEGICQFPSLPIILLTPRLILT